MSNVDTNLSNVDTNHDLWCDNWRIYQNKLADKYVYQDYLTPEQIKVLYKEHPQLLIEILSYFSTKEKENIARNPSDSITMDFTPLKDEALDITRTKRFDLLDAADAISEVLAKQLNYKGWVE